MRSSRKCLFVGFSFVLNKKQDSPYIDYLAIGFHNIIYVNIYLIYVTSFPVLSNGVLIGMPSSVSAYPSASAP